MHTLASQMFEIHSLTVKSNYSDWNKAKEQLSKQYPFNTPLYIHAAKPVGLTVGEIEQLRDYLNGILGFLEKE